MKFQSLQTGQRSATSPRRDHNSSRRGSFNPFKQVNGLQPTTKANPIGLSPTVSIPSNRSTVCNPTLKFPFVLRGLRPRFRPGFGKPCEARLQRPRNRPKPFRINDRRTFASHFRAISSRIKSLGRISHRRADRPENRLENPPFLPWILSGETLGSLDIASQHPPSFITCQSFCTPCFCF